MNQTSPTKFPLFLDLTRRPCLVVGGGGVGQRKVESLVAAGADVTVVALDATAEIERMHREGTIVWHRRAYVPEEAATHVLVFAATGDSVVNEMVSNDAARAGRLVNVVDQPELCGFFSGAVVTRGALQVAVSSGGQVPMLARRLREEFDRQIPAAYDELVQRLGRFRRELHDKVSAPGRRTEILRRVVDSVEVREFLDGNREPLERLLSVCDYS
jgi:siroheme synthase-like protein